MLPSTIKTSVAITHCASSQGTNLPKRAKFAARASSTRRLADAMVLNPNVRSTVYEKNSQVMYSSTAVQFRLLGYSSDRAVLSNTVFPNSNTRRDKLLRGSQGTTLPEKTAFAARAKKVTRGLSDANFSRKSHVRIHESIHRERKKELFGVLL